MGNVPTYDEIKDRLSKRQKIGQLFMPAVFINDTEAEIKNMERLIAEGYVGSLCFFHSRASAATNFEGKKKVVHNAESYQRLIELIARYQKAAPIPLLIAIDAEWGLAMRVEKTRHYPYAITLGAMQNQTDLVRQVGAQIAFDCKSAGIHWNLSPVVDINTDPENPVIGYRSFGFDKEQVTTYAQAYIEGANTQGVLNSINHFPGPGDTATDSHLELPVIDKTKAALFEEELHPFVQLMQTDSIDAVMVGHLAVPALTDGALEPASLSKKILTDFLRGELAWDGIIISDALNMHAISKRFEIPGELEYTAFEAGNDLLCFADAVNAGIDMIDSHGTSKRIERSFERVWRLKQKALTTPLTSQPVPTSTYPDLMAQLAKASLTQLKGNSEEIAVFRKQRYGLVEIGKPVSRFTARLHPSESDKRSLLVITPPQAKPKQNFGLSLTELERIRHLLDTRDSIIYLFGNPFLLDKIPWNKAQAVVVVFQDFPEFQDNAATHFEGGVAAPGKLPVQLKSLSR